MTTAKHNAGKRLTEAAWDALLEALAVFYWYRGDLEAFVRAELIEAPELLARLNFSATKREVAAEVVSLLRRQEDRYQPLVLDMLVRLAEFDRRFPRLARLDDATAKIATAQAALDEVLTIVETYSEQAAAREEIRAEAVRQRLAAEQRRSHENLLKALKDRFLEFQAMTDVVTIQVPQLPVAEKRP